MPIHKTMLFKYNINKLTKVEREREDIDCPILLDNSKSFGFIPKILDGESGQTLEGLSVLFI